MERLPPAPALPAPDPDQLAFATARNAPIIALASPPGTGKTTSLVHRFCALVEDGIDPWRIACLTFSRRARDTLREKLKTSNAPIALGLPDDTEPPTCAVDAEPALWIGTYHQVCARILRHHPEALGIGGTIRIAAGQEMRIRMRQALRDTNALPQCEAAAARSVTQAVHELNEWKLAGVDPRDSETHPIYAPRTRPSSDTRRAWRAYQLALVRDHRLDLPDLPLALHRLFVHRPDIRAAWSKRFDHVLVDEFQDSDLILCHLLRILGHTAHIAVAGDPDQSIYGFRRAIGSFEPLRWFEPTHGPATLVVLRTDYRLPRGIQSAANALRATMAVHGPSPNPSTSDAWTAPHHVQYPQDAKGEQILGALIDETLARDAGPDPDHRPFARAADRRPSAPEDCVVVCRTNAQCATLARRLAAIGRAVWIANEAHAAPLPQALVAWACAVADPGDPQLESAFSSLPFRLPPGAFDTVRREARARGIGLWPRLYQRAYESTPAPDTAPEPLALATNAFGQLIAFRDAHLTDGPLATVHAIIDTLKLTSHAGEASDTENHAYREVVALATALAPRCPDIETLAELLAGAHLAGANAPPGHVQLRTMHAMKGSEARHLFAYDWHEGNFPDDLAELEEARRLAFTSLTRASRTFISLSARHNAHGRELPVSRFVHEAKLPVIVRT